MTAPLPPEIAHLLRGQATIAGKIRALAAAGYPRAEIARMLGKRYQHVRNVLEEPRKARTPPPIPMDDPEGMAEGDPGAFIHNRPKTYGLEVRNGSVTIPPEVLNALGAGPDGSIIAELDGEFFRLVAPRESIRQAQELMRPYWKPGVSTVDEFIVDRRREAAEEDRAHDEWRTRHRRDD